MAITVTSYIDVVSSWCFWSEPMWAELKVRYEGRVDFRWKIALMDKTGLPTSREQHDWFYRRSGMMMRSPFMLNSHWCEHTEAEFVAPNAIAEAGRDLGAQDDRIRLAIASAALREGMKIGDWNVSAEVAARASGLDKKKLLERAQSPEVEKRLRATTAEFHDLKVTQRPTFVIDTEIGDRAVFSGIVKVEPLAATLDSLLEDAAAYAAHAAHFGAAPAA
jgi:predicted DsbA family dithiol-disulfide isomerase